MNYLYKHLSVDALVDRIEKMDIHNHEDRLRLFTFFSANLLHLMPQIDVNTHEAHFREVCLHQHLSWKDQFDPDLHNRMQIKGWDQNVIEKFRSSPGMICTYHTGSYRLINRLLVEAGVAFSLIVSTEVYNTEAASFKAAFDRYNSSSQTFDLIDAEQPTALLKMIRAAKSGRNLLVYVDGNTGAGKSTANNLTVDFMDGQLSVRKGIAVLASILKRTIYPISCIRPAIDKVHFNVHDSIIQREGIARDSFVQYAMQQIYTDLASVLKEDPFQWECWLHLHQSLVLSMDNVPPDRVTMKELTDARLWASFKINKQSFVLHKPSFSSFKIPALSGEMMRIIQT
jgi:lauroyl/myristoyl acyltransferase